MSQLGDFLGKSSRRKGEKGVLHLLRVCLGPNHGGFSVGPEQTNVG